MSNSWVGIAETTIRDHIREVEEDVMRNRRWLAKLQADGRVTYNHAGDDCDWRIKYKRALPRDYSDMDTVTFPRRNRHKTAVLPWRAASLDESISKFDQLKNRGIPAIVKLLETKVGDMTEDFEDWFGDQLYIDGNATGNTKKIHGIESFNGAGSPASAGYIAAPSDTYAGLSTALGNYGGSWSVNGSSQVDWPSGTGSAEYDFFSPLLVDYTDTAWAATTKTWANTCEEALAYAIIKSTKNTSKRGRINMCLLNDELFRLFREKIRGREQVWVNQGTGGKGNSLTGLGFGDVINYEGVEVSYEYGVPSAVGYGFNTAQMELRSMQATLFDFGIKNKYDETAKTLKFSIDFFGNMMFRPRYFFKVASYT